MKPTNLPTKSDLAHTATVTRRIQIHSRGLILRVSAILVLAGLLAGSLYWSSAASASKNASPNQKAAVAGDEITMPSAIGALGGSPSLRVGSFSSLLPFPQAGVSVTTYASDCTTPKTVFNLQDADKTVCAIVTGANPSWRIIWSNANFVAVQNVAVGSGTSTFTLTSASSLGDWRVILFEPIGGTVQGVTSFTVIDAANPVAELQVSKTGITNQAAAGAQVVFAVDVRNAGPSSASTVQLTDTVPTGTTFVSFAQLSGPVFTCVSPSPTQTGSTTCTIASLGRGDSATFIATYLVDAGVATGTEISNTANVSSSVFDNNSGNNSSTAVVSVANAPCVVTGVADITVDADAGQAGAIVTYAAPSSTGDCGQPQNNQGSPISCNPASGSFFSLGSTTVICAGQTGNPATFQVTVNNPGGGLVISLNGASPLTHECGTSFSDPGATAINGAGQNVSVTITGSTCNSEGNCIGRDTPSGTYTLTYTANDGPNSVSTTRTVIVSDTQAPIITIGGANPYKIQQGSCSPFVDPGVSATDDCGGSTQVTSSLGLVTDPGPPPQTVPATSINTSTAGTYIITYTATDGTHETTATRTVIVGNFPEDEVDQPASGNVPPTITLNGDDQISIECGTPFTDPGATASVCGGPVPVTTSGTVDIHAPGIYSITYTATANGQTAETTRIVTVEADNTAPTITLDGANPITVECHTGTFTDPGATAHDACAGDFPATASGTVNIDVVGPYTITYNATDPSGHAAAPVTRTVNVVDTTAPTVTAPANVTVNTGAGDTSCTATVTDAVLGTASANDACQGSLPTTRSGVPSGNIFPIGTTTITYSATDDSNNSGTATQTVTVIDNTPPTITLNGANPMTVECHTSFTDPGATAHDNCSADFAATATGSVNPNVVGTYTITYNASDTAGNPATPVTRTVIVQDTTKPVITLNGANPQYVECHTSYPELGATANDSCAGSFAATPSGSVNANVVGTYTITYNATDPSGNAATPVTRTVIVQDTTAPTITLNGQTPSMWPPNHKYHTFGVAGFVTGVSDSCDTPLGVGSVVIEKVTSDEIENGNGDGNTLNDIVIAADCKSVQLRSEREGGGNGRVYTIFFKVTDASGNVGLATAKVVVPHNPGQTPVDSGVHYTVSCP